MSSLIVISLWQLTLIFAEIVFSVVGLPISLSFRGASSTCLLFVSPDMPSMKRVYKDKWAPIHWSAARNKKSASRPAHKPRINRSPTAGQPRVLFFPGLRRISFRASEEMFRPFFSMPWRAQGTVVSCANNPVGAPSCRARPAVRSPTRPARGVSGFWIRQICFFEPKMPRSKQKCKCWCRRCCSSREHTQIASRPWLLHQEY